MSLAVSKGKDVVCPVSHFKKEFLTFQQQLVGKVDCCGGRILSRVSSAGGIFYLLMTSWSSWKSTRWWVVTFTSFIGPLNCTRQVPVKDLASLVSWGTRRGYCLSRQEEFVGSNLFQEQPPPYNLCFFVNNFNHCRHKSREQLSNQL